MSKSLKATELLLEIEDAFCEPHEHWPCEAWSANVLSTAGRARKDCFEQDNGATSYLNSGLLQLGPWKLRSFLEEYFLALWEGWDGMKTVNTGLY